MQLMFWAASLDQPLVGCLSTLRSSMPAPSSLRLHFTEVETEALEFRWQFQGSVPDQHTSSLCRGIPIAWPGTCHRQLGVLEGSQRQEHEPWESGLAYAKRHVLSLRSLGLCSGEQNDCNDLTYQ